VFVVQSSKILGAASALVLAFGFASNKAHAAGAPAGTQINNTASVNYTVGTVNATASSNLVTVTVVEMIDVNVTAQTPNLTVSPGDTAQVARYRIQNTGNGPETFRLVLNNAITTDTFDPVAASPAIYLDSGGGVTTAGIFDSSDVVYVPGSNDPALAPDAFVIVFVVNDIPGTALDGQLGISRLTADSRTGTGPAGTTFAGQGNGISGAVDAVIGVSTGADSDDTTYAISGVSVTAAKTQAVVDTWGGARPVPGARINYSIAVNATGSGTATNVVFTDNIPANTTYVAGSLALNGVPVTDAAGLPDDGDYLATPTARVRVPLGSLNTAAGTKTITFSVTIN
jgi:uncharacterized repeat protein (TIGR01451 family)